MVVCGAYLTMYDMEGAGYLKIIVGDIKYDTEMEILLLSIYLKFRESNLMKALYVYCKESKDSKRLLQDERFLRGSIFQVKGEYLRCKAFGTPKQGNK